MSWRYLRSADRLTANLINMKLFKPNGTNITLFFAASIAAACSMPRITDAEIVTTKIPVGPDDGVDSSSSSSSVTSSTAKAPAACPNYGCPLLPRDMYFDEEAQAALKAIRSLHEKYGSHVTSSSSSAAGTQSTASATVSTTGSSTVNEELKGPELNLTEALELLKTVGGQDQATLTLIGYKGGNIEDQINQDRAFVISPYYINNHGEEKKPQRLLGVFDGHANKGELVSEYTVTHLPELLSSKLDPILDTSSSDEGNDHSEAIHTALVETFVEIDKNAPASQSGGCTASIVLQLGPKLYVANAGDSRSFVATYDKSTSNVNIAYITREDKPDLPEERARVERMGGQVYIPPQSRGSSRVLFVDKKTGNTNGLAMSRSIGDWDAAELGVIPDPTVAVLDVFDLVKNAGGGDIEVFAVSATDGLLDFVDIDSIAKTIAHSLYVDEGPHPLSACESLITTAATAWWKAKDGRYRDDIAIAVSKMNL